MLSCICQTNWDMVSAMLSSIWSQINWDAASAIGTWVFGLVVVISLFYVKTQIKQAQESIKSTSYHSTYGLMVGIDQFFITNSEMIKYFRNGIEYTVDNVFHQQETLPSEEAYQGFRRFMQDTYLNSPALRLYLHDNGRWYPPAFLQMITQNPQR